MKKRFSSLWSFSNLLVCLALCSWSVSTAQDLASVSNASSTKKATDKNTIAPFKVKGKVRDNTGPLAGVTVSEKEKSNATTTNAEGNFELTVSGPNAVVVFSFVGYKSTELPVNGQSDLSTTLELGTSQ